MLVLARNWPRRYQLRTASRRHGHTYSGDIPLVWPFRVPLQPQTLFLVVRIGTLTKLCFVLESIAGRHRMGNLLLCLFGKTEVSLRRVELSLYLFFRNAMVDLQKMRPC
jgi:hypothetical protein